MRARVFVALVGIAVVVLGLRALRTEPTERLADSEVTRPTPRIHAGKKGPHIEPAGKPPTARTAAIPHRETENADGPDADLVEQASQAISANKVSEAATLLQQLVDRHPENYEVRAELGFLYSELKQDAKALEQFRTALLENAENGEALTELVNIYARQNRLREGERFLKELAEKFPDNPKIDLARADINERRGDLPAALVDTQRAASRPSATNEVNDYEARLHARLGDKDAENRSLEEFQRQARSKRHLSE